jgi:hypothetical protein
LSYNPRGRFISQFHAEFPAHAFERERHLPDQFRLEWLARKEWSYRHAISNCMSEQSSRRRN